MESDLSLLGIASALAKTQAKSLGREKILSLIEVPPQPGLGDYALPCFLLAKELKKNPNEIAVQIWCKQHWKEKNCNDRVCPAQHKQATAHWAPEKHFSCNGN